MSRRIHRQPMARRLLAEAARLGCVDTSVQPGGRHPRIVGRIEGRPFKFFFSAAPAGPRMEANLVTAFRRAIRVVLWR